MKKSLISIAIISMICILAVVFVGCSQAEPLAEPTNLRLNGKVLTWSEVANANGYLVVIGNDEYEVNESRFEMYFILEAGNYEVRVKALGDGEIFADSPWASKTVALSGPTQSGSDEKGFEYTYIEDRQGYEISRGSASLIGRVTIPDYFEGLPVVRIGNLWLPYDATKRNYFTEVHCNVVTTSVTLPKYLESISQESFSYMVRLTEIVIPDTVTEIEDMAFFGCTHLTKVVLPSGLKVIPMSCFQGTALAEITLPNGLEEIGIYAFRCETIFGSHVSSDLSSIVIPASVKKIGEGAFDGRENLQNVRLENSANLEEFSRLVFKDTKWYQDQEEGLVYLDGILYCYKGQIPADTVLNISSDVNGIAGGAFESQNNLKKITLSHGVKLLGAQIFMACTELEEVILPDDLTVIPGMTFAVTKKLTNISLPSTLLKIGKSAFGGSVIEKITIPVSVKTIENSTFFQCYSLVEVELPEGLEVIGPMAFQQCISLSKINLPKTLKSLGDNAFAACNSLESIVIPASLEELGQTPFSNCKILESIYYEGTQQQWATLFAQHNAVNVGYSPLANATLYYYSATEPTDSGDYWHYDTDGQTPVIWSKED